MKLKSVLITLWTLEYISIWTNHRIVWHSAVLSRLHLNVFFSLIKSFTIFPKSLKTNFKYFFLFLFLTAEEKLFKQELELWRFKRTLPLPVLWLNVCLSKYIWNIISLSVQISGAKQAGRLEWPPWCKTVSNICFYYYLCFACYCIYSYECREYCIEQITYIYITIHIKYSTWGKSAQQQK